MLQLGAVDPHSTELLHQEERFAEIIKEYELQSRVRTGSCVQECCCNDSMLLPMSGETPDALHVYGRPREVVREQSWFGGGGIDRQALPHLGRPQLGDILHGFHTSTTG